MQLNSEKLRKLILARAGAGPLVGLIAIFLLFSIVAPAGFASGRNVETILRQSAIVGTVALGSTLVIISGAIDLSVGSIVAFTTVIVAAILQAGGGPLAAIGCGLLSGAIIGLLSGSAIAWMRAGPFITTLGGLLIIRGAAKGLANEQKIDAPLSWINSLLATLPPNQAWMIVPLGVWLAALLAIAVAFILNRTVFGRYVYAIGSNERAAVLCGVPAEKVRICVYVMGAMLAAVGGVLQFSRLTVGDPTVAVGLELDAIAAAVIGGASLGGGEGSILGTVAGALIMAVIRSGSSQIGLPNWIQEIVTGLIIIAAVTLDRLRHRK